MGRAICNELLSKGYAPVIFSRNLNRKIFSPEINVKVIQWNNDSNKMAEMISGAYGVINLAGASIAGARWTTSYKDEIISSRVNTTRTIVEAIKMARIKPLVFISASAVGYYGNRYDEEIDENSTPGSGFLSEVCKMWESEAIPAKEYSRTIIARIGIVLDKNEGALGKMLPIFKMSVGGPLGTGKQWMPWIHIKDTARMFVWALENTKVDGVVNFCTPTPVRMRQFAKDLGKAINRPVAFPVPSFSLRLILGESADMVLSSQRVIPRKALDLGFDFKFSNLFEAFSDIIKN